MSTVDMYLSKKTLGYDPTVPVPREEMSKTDEIALYENLKAYADATPENLAKIIESTRESEKTKWEDALEEAGYVLNEDGNYVLKTSPLADFKFPDLSGLGAGMFGFGTGMIVMLILAFVFLMVLVVAVR